MANKKGIDISTFNGNFDLQSAKKQGAEFVIIRCGYGSDLTSQDDDRFKDNVKKCEAAGMPYGVYLYSYAKTNAQAQSEAAHTLRLIKGTKPSYGVWYDIEDSGLPSGDTLINNCVTYCNAIENAGYYVGIYATASWFKTKLNSSKLAKWGKWVAHWGVSSPGYTDGMVIWQYTNPPNDAASPTAYDWNISYKEFVKEEEDMTQAQTQDLINKAVAPIQTELDSLKKTYKYIEDVPEWYKDGVQYYMDKGLLKGKGTSNGKVLLDLTATECRLITLMYRAETDA